MYKILIVEDDKEIANSIANQLALWQYSCKVVEDFNNILNDFVTFKADLVLLDISLPLFDGYHWCQQIRNNSSVPIIFISSASDNMSIIMAMNLGGDDYICKPFEMNVLIAKISALLRRSYTYRNESQLLEHKGLIINMSDNTVSYQDNIIDLSKNEYRILLTIIQNKGKVVSREKLMEVLWKTDIYIDENTLSVNVNRLRKKLEQAGITDLIQTRFGVGYIAE